MSKRIKFIFKLIISLGFLAWVVFRVSWSEVFLLLNDIEVKYIIAYFAILILGVSISTYKWRELAKFRGINLSYFDYLKFYLAGTFVNNFMPSFIGGDTFRAYQIGKVDKKYSEAASSVVIDRLTGLFGAMLLTLVFSLINFSAIVNNHILFVLNLGVLVGVIAVLVFFATKKFSFWKKMTLHKIGIVKYIPEKILKFIDELAQYNSNANVLWQAVGWSVVFSLVGLAATNYVLFLALGAKISLLNYMSVIFLISIVSSAPISINNIGLKEWAYVTFFGFFGISSAIVITVAILSRFLQMLLSFTALPIYLKSKE